MSSKDLSSQAFSFKYQEFFKPGFIWYRGEAVAFVKEHYTVQLLLTIPPLITALLKYPPALFGLPLNLWRKSFGLGGVDSLVHHLSKALLKKFNKVYEHFLVFIPDTRICTKKCITQQHHKKKSNRPDNRFWILSEK